MATYEFNNVCRDSIDTGYLSSLYAKCLTSKLGQRQSSGTWFLMLLVIDSGYELEFIAGDPTGHTTFSRYRPFANGCDG